MSVQQIDAQIMGQSYILSAPPEEVADVRAAVSRVDEAMCRIRDAGKIKARERIAVLAALNVAFDAQQEQKQAALAAPAAVADAPSAAPAHPAEGEAAEPHARLAALLLQLDHALGRDGHLL